MNMTIGAQDRKKVFILAGLLVVAAVVFYINSSSDPTSGPDPAAIAAGPRPVAPATATVRPATSAATTTSRIAARNRQQRNQRQLAEFKPSLKPRRPEDQPDPTTMDPTLRLDLLSKLQTVNVEGTHRNMFDFGAAPPPKPAVDPKKPAVPSPIITPTPAATAPSGPPTPPPPPPITLKFYGFISAQNAGAKRAFFLDGEDIHVVTEGDVVKRRFKIVRIGVNSVVIEDLDYKNQQTVPLEAAPAG